MLMKQRNVICNFIPNMVQKWRQMREFPVWDFTRRTQRCLWGDLQTNCWIFQETGQLWAQPHSWSLVIIFRKLGKLLSQKFVQKFIIHPLAVFFTETPTSPFCQPGNYCPNSCLEKNHVFFRWFFCLRMQSAEVSPALRDLSKAPKYSSGSSFPIKGKNSALAVCTFLMISPAPDPPAKHIHRK